MEKINPALVPQRKLNNGMVIPGIGMGTFGNDKFEPEQVSQAVAGAIRAGYRLFDCAAAYQNEKEIGKVFELSKMAVSKRLKKLHEKLRSSVT